MVVVDASSTSEHDFFLPASLNGTVYVSVSVSVRDMVAKPGEVTTYAVEVHQLLIRTENGAGALIQSLEEQNIDVSSLSATGFKVREFQVVDLRWSVTQASAIDIYRDGLPIATTTANIETFNDNIGQRGGGSYAYKVCELNSTTCSNIVGIVF